MKKALSLVLLILLLLCISACREAAPLPPAETTEKPQYRCPELTVPLADTWEYGGYFFKYNGFVYIADIADGEASIGLCKSDEDMNANYALYNQFVEFPSTEDTAGLVIPAAINGAPVVRFHWDGEHDVTYPDTVREILHCGKTEVFTVSAQVDSLWFRQVPAGAAGSTFSHIGRVEVDPANKTFSSKDGVLFSKDGSVLLHYPALRPGDRYVIPAGVREIGAAAVEFLYVREEEVPEPRLTELVIPPSVTVIDEAALIGGWGQATIVIAPGSAAEKWVLEANRIAAENGEEQPFNIKLRQWPEGNAS